MGRKRIIDENKLYWLFEGYNRWLAMLQNKSTNGDALDNYILDYKKKHHINQDNFWFDNISHAEIEALPIYEEE